jgi:hypothetical protein
MVVWLQERHRRPEIGMDTDTSTERYGLHTSHDWSGVDRAYPDFKTCSEYFEYPKVSLQGRSPTRFPAIHLAPTPFALILFPQGQWRPLLHTITPTTFANPNTVGITSSEGEVETRKAL